MKNKTMNSFSYRENLARLLRAGWRMKKANRLASKLTKAQVKRKKQQYREQLEKEMQKYGII